MIADLKVIARDCWKTLTRPTPLTFTAISNNAHGRLVLSMIVTMLIIEISVICTLTLLKNPLAVVLRLMLEYAIDVPILFLLWAFFVYKISCNIFHCTKSDYESIFYILVLIIAVSEVFTFIALPVSLLSDSVSSVITYAGWLYTLILAVTATYALTRLPIWKSVLTVIVSGALAAVGGLALLFFFAAITRTVPLVL